MSGLPFGAFLLLISLPSIAYPYKVSKFNEAVDAIGSKRKCSEVEPADWNVALTRIGGVFLALYGSGVILVNL